MAQPVDENRLRGLVTQHLELETVVSQDEALCVLESLIIKDRNGQLRPNERQFLDSLKAEGLVSV